MEPAKSLIRTTVRSFLPQPRAILITDALLIYSVLHLDDLVILFATQAKDLRKELNSLLAHRLISKATRAEARVGAARAIQREYYYINFHESVDAIKYRIVKLLEKVKALYSEDQTKRKDWSCPRCKAEYDEYAILDKISPDGFYCERCGEVLVQNEAAVRERGDHAKIRQINDQLRPFQDLIAQIDRQAVPENTFDEAWEKKRDIPKSREHMGAGKAVYVALDRPQKEDQLRRQEVVSAENIKVTIATATERERADAEAKRRAAELNARKNVLPEWHTKSAIGLDSGRPVKSEDGGASPLPGIKREEDEKKASILEESKMQDDLDAYMAEMERERLQKEREEAERAEQDEEEEEDDFEDVPGSSAIGTPISSQQIIKQEKSPTSSRINGIKRELDADGDSISGTSTGANTPIHTGPSSAPDPKRIKLENGSHGPAIKVESAGTGQANGVAAADSDEDDEEFEDV
ncbi:hypothetical protein H2198_009592 [Neophaeococcomyces mojaviensis]|uniref:Uncharacterized protein n=1 Tax=Neophaeococcomyces mojaviensis TaxID=3383035 RepID=A0ACC2ZU45_9EURO|nr:hypothetical protein H2198_009592 [Knufia sp. JES_112]